MRGLLLTGCWIACSDDHTLPRFLYPAYFARAFLPTSSIVLILGLQMSLCWMTAFGRASATVCVYGMLFLFTSACRLILTTNKSFQIPSHIQTMIQQFEPIFTYIYFFFAVGFPSKKNVYRILLTLMAQINQNFICVNVCISFLLPTLLEPYSSTSITPVYLDTYFFFFFFLRKT